MRLQDFFLNFIERFGGSSLVNDDNSFSCLTNQETEADRSSHMTSDDEQKLTSEIDEEGNKVLPAGKH